MREALYHIDGIRSPLFAYAWKFGMKAMADSGESLALTANLRDQRPHVVHRPRGVAQVHLQRVQHLLLEPLGVHVVPRGTGQTPLGHQVLDRPSELSAAFLHAHGSLTP